MKRRRIIMIGAGLAVLMFVISSIPVTAKVGGRIKMNFTRHRGGLKSTELEIKNSKWQSVNQIEITVSPGTYINIPIRLNGEWNGENEDYEHTFVEYIGEVIDLDAKSKIFSKKASFYRQFEFWRDNQNPLPQFPIFGMTFKVPNDLGKREYEITADVDYDGEINRDNDIRDKNRITKKLIVNIEHNSEENNVEEKSKEKTANDNIVNPLPFDGGLFKFFFIAFYGKLSI